MYLGQFVRSAALAVCAVIFASHAVQAQATTKELTLSAPLLPGHSNGDDTGREIVIVREVMESCGYNIRFTYDLFGNHWSRYFNLDLDGVLTVPAETNLPGTMTDSHVSFHNGVVWVADDPDEVYEHLSDLADKRVAAFGSAREILPEINPLVPTFQSYSEHAFQNEQIELLYTDAVDALVADGMIIAELVLNFRVSSDKGFTYPFDIYQPLRFKALFDPTPYHVLFRDPQITEDFNRCLADITEDGRLDELNREALAPHRFALGSEYLGY